MPTSTAAAPALEPFLLPLHDRWVLASRIAHRLAPAAQALGGYATAEVRVAVGRQAPRRPAVAVVRGALPVQPLVRVPPLLVVELAPVCSPQHWLDLGALAVWSLGREAALVSPAGGPAQRLVAPARLHLDIPALNGPALTLQLPVEEAGCGAQALTGSRQRFR